MHCLAGGCQGEGTYSGTNEPLRIFGYVCIIRAYIEDGTAG